MLLAPYSADGRPNGMHRVHVRRWNRWRAWNVWKPTMDDAVEEMRRMFPTAEVKPYDHATELAQMKADRNTSR